MRRKTLQIIGFVLILVISIGLSVSGMAENNPIGYVFMYLAGMDFVFLLSAIIPGYDTAKIKIKYFDDEIDSVESMSVGNWIDLRAAQTVELKAGERKLIPLGVAMKLPKGYEAIIAPRSSTAKNFKIIQANSIGVIDESYCGDGDQWMFPAMALEDTVIQKNDRICQFRIVRHQPEIRFIETEKLDSKDRGGFGSTGTH